MGRGPTELPPPLPPNSRLVGTLVASLGLGPGSLHNSRKSSIRVERVSDMGLWNVWMGGEPLTLRRTGCGAEGARLLVSEDVEGELVGDMGVFVPVQQLAVKRLFPSRAGDKLRVQGIPPQDLPSQWPQEESCSALCCSCHCSWALAGALVLQGFRWWRERSHLNQQQTEEPGGHSWVRIPRTPPDCPAPSWPAHAHYQ